MPITALSTSFAPPLRYQTLPSDQIRRSNKGELSDSDNGDDILSDDSAELSTLRTGLTPAETEQYRIAGLTANRTVPEKPFPYANEGTRKYRWVGPSEIQKHLSRQNPRLHVDRSFLNPVDGTDKRSRLKHVGYLTTLFHRCFLQGLLPQAYRAFSMILAAAPGTPGRYQERLRIYGHWALAAELIMKGIMTNPEIPGAPARSTDKDIYRPYSRRNIQLARNFLEVLVLQYPPLLRRHLTAETKYRTPTAVDFYDSLFSVWIYEITQGRCGISLEDSNDMPEVDHLTAIKGHATQLASRLDLILASTEYTTIPQLLQLRGYVELWLGTLSRNLVEAQAKKGQDVVVGSEPEQGAMGQVVDPDGDVDMNADLDHEQLGSEIAAGDEDPYASKLRGIDALHRTRAERFFAQALKYSPSDDTSISAAES